MAMCLKSAQQRHDITAQGLQAPPMKPIEGFPAMFESRLVMLLLRILPESVKTPENQMREVRRLLR